jgi:hypothetical protein
LQGACDGDPIGDEGYAMEELVAELDRHDMRGRDVVTRRPVWQRRCDAEKIADGFGWISENVAGAYRSSVRKQVCGHLTL